MDAVLDSAARALANGYILYIFLLAATAFYGAHLLTLGVLLALALRRSTKLAGPFFAGERALPLQLLYGFLNPLIYLLILNRDGAMLRWNALDPWLTAMAWTLFA